MIRKNKWKLIISSIVILLPTLLGIFADKLLPEKIAVHWNILGEADGWGNATIFFIVLPIVLLGVHWLCMLLTARLDKDTEQNQKITGIMFWIIPLISLLSCATVFMTALGYVSNAFCIVMLLMGVTFTVIGNYMPKATQSRTVGIKIKWTYSSEENWNATHRFAGKLWVAIGIVCLLAMPLPTVAFPFIAIFVILASTLPPTVYSYRFYKKQLADGTVTKESAEQTYSEFTGIKNKKAFTVIIVIITVVLVALLALTMFSGSVTATLDDTSLSVDSSFWAETIVKYEDITSVEYREEGVDGERVGGFGSAKLLLGNFANSEFGAYTRYTYTGDRPCIVITAGKRTLVVGLENAEQTEALYNEIFEKISK